MDTSTNVMAIHCRARRWCVIHASPLVRRVAGQLPMSITETESPRVLVT